MDVAAFTAALQSSQLCQPEVWPALDVNDLVLLYDSSVTAALYRIAPLRMVHCRRRPSDWWFDEDCHLAKRLVCRLERDARKADAINSTAATAAWRTQCRIYSDLLRQKRESFWLSNIDSEKSGLHQLWQSVDVLMG